METFFQSNPGMRSRLAHHLEFPDFAEGELLRIAEMMLEQQNYRFGPGARETFQEYIAHRIRQPQFANARSVRNALDRAFFEMMACTLESEIVGVPDSGDRQDRVTEVLRILSKYA